MTPNINSGSLHAHIHKHTTHTHTVRKYDIPIHANMHRATHVHEIRKPKTKHNKIEKELGSSAETSPLLLNRRFK